VLLAVLLETTFVPYAVEVYVVTMEGVVGLVKCDVMISNNLVLNTLDPPAINTSFYALYIYEHVV